MAAMGMGAPLPPMDPSMMDPAMMDPAMMGMDPAMMGMPPAGGMPMDPAMMGGPMPPQTATPLGGAGAAPGMAVDMGGMGMPPPMAPSEDDLIMNALQAVLGKWSGNQTMIAGEKNALLQTLMVLASSQPPTAPEAFVEGGMPGNFAMTPGTEPLAPGPAGMGY